MDKKKGFFSNLLGSTTKQSNVSKSKPEEKTKVSTKINDPQKDNKTETPQKVTNLTSVSSPDVSKEKKFVPPKVTDLVSPKEDTKQLVQPPQVPLIPSEPSEPGALIICKQSGNTLALSNFIYVHPECVFSSAKYISINNMIYAVKCDHRLASKHHIGFNSCQRGSCNIGETIEIKPSIWTPPADKSNNIYSLEIKIIPIFIKGASKTYKIDETYFADIFRKRFNDHVFTTKQSIFFSDSSNGHDDNISGNVFKFCIETIKAIDRKNEGISFKEIPYGIMSKYSKVHLNLDQDVILKRDNGETVETSLIKAKVEETPEFLDPNWKFSNLGIGGLDNEFGVIFRRAFQSRYLPKGLAKQLDIKHVKGLLLYGPPGTGKTLIARQISKVLKGQEPKIVNGPEIMNKMVGQSEENIRNLFADAEADEKKNGDKAKLHVIIFDEIDAICKARGTTSGGTGVNDAVVNQLLTKIDGVNQINNILVIGMTNRKDMLDAALLRPGRLEVHVEIGLPDEKGRFDILTIHTQKLKDSGRLDDDVNLSEIAKRTKNYSGAELQGVVQSAKSFALIEISKDYKDNMFDAESMAEKYDDTIIQMRHFLMAIEEIPPAFGVEQQNLKIRVPYGISKFNSAMEKICDDTSKLISKLKTDKDISTCKLLFEGPSGCGKTALSAQFALESGCSFIKIICPENYVGLNENDKISKMAKVFDDAYRTPLAMIIIEDIERLLDYVAIGPRFSNNILQALKILISQHHPRADRKLVIIATTSNYKIMKELDLDDFDLVQTIPMLESKSDFQKAIIDMGLDKKIDQHTLNMCSNQSMSIKKFLSKVNISNLITKPK